jgi:hypothetical protein
LNDFEDDVTIYIDDPTSDPLTLEPRKDPPPLDSEPDTDDFQSFIDDQDDNDPFNPKLLIPGQNIMPRSHQEHRHDPLPS